MNRLGISMIAAYSPEARGRSERAFGTHQGRLPNELALMGITSMEAANHYLKEHYMPRFNKAFSHPAREQGNAFVPLAGIHLDDYLCERFERVVGKDNSVQFETLSLQLPNDQHRYHYVKAKIQVSRHLDGSLSIDHGPRRLGRYTADGILIQHKENKSKAA